MDDHNSIELEQEVRSIHGEHEECIYLFPDILNDNVVWKVCDRKRPWRNLRYYPGMCLKRTRKTTKNFSQNNLTPGLKRGLLRTTHVP
jgi:hypothetical protein